MDVLRDIYRYITDSMRQGLRERRGQVVRRSVMSGSTIPGNWQIFLHTDENKTELFAFLAEQVATLELQRKEIQTTYDEVQHHLRNQE